MRAVSSYNESTRADALASLPWRSDRWAEPAFTSKHVGPSEDFKSKYNADQEAVSTTLVMMTMGRNFASLNRIWNWLTWPVVRRPHLAIGAIVRIKLITGSCTACTPQYP